MHIVSFAMGVQAPPRPWPNVGQRQDYRPDRGVPHARPRVRYCRSRRYVGWRTPFSWCIYIDRSVVDKLERGATPGILDFRRLNSTDRLADREV